MQEYISAGVQHLDCYILVNSLNEDIPFENLTYDQTFRSKNLRPTFSRFEYSENNPSLLTPMRNDDYEEIVNSLALSEQQGCVQVVCYLHIDDASQVQSKMWKSASVFDIQLAGAPAGIKGGESNNMILALTDTSKISLRRLFDNMCGEFQRIDAEGFTCFDCFSGKVEKVKMPIAAVFGDLPARAEITPFKGEAQPKKSRTTPHFRNVHINLLK